MFGPWPPRTSCPEWEPHSRFKLRLLYHVVKDRLFPRGRWMLDKDLRPQPRIVVKCVCGQWRLGNPRCRHQYDAFNRPCWQLDCVQCDTMEANLADGGDAAMETDLMLSAMVQQPTRPDGTPWEDSGRVTR